MVAAVTVIVTMVQSYCNDLFIYRPWYCHRDYGTVVALVLKIGAGMTMFLKVRKDCKVFWYGWQSLANLKKPFQTGILWGSKTLSNLHQLHITNLVKPFSSLHILHTSLLMGQGQELRRGNHVIFFNFLNELVQCT